MFVSSNPQQKLLTYSPKASQADKPASTGSPDQVHVSKDRKDDLVIPKPESKAASFVKRHGAAIAGGLVTGVAAAAVGMMGGAAGAVAGAIGGVMLGTAAVGGLLGAGIVALAKSGTEGALLVVGLLICGAALTPFLGAAALAGAGVGAAACGALGAVGGPVAAAVAGTGCGLLGAAVVGSAQKAFAK